MGRGKCDVVDCDLTRGGVKSHAAQPGSVVEKRCVTGPGFWFLGWIGWGWRGTNRRRKLCFWAKRIKRDRRERKGNNVLVGIS